MKTFKLLVASLVIGCFFFTNDLSVQGNPDKTLDWPVYFFCYCAGEPLSGTLVFNHHITPNGAEHYNAMSGQLVGGTTGETYRVVDSEHFGSKSMTINFLIIGKNGKVRAEHHMYNSGEYEGHSFVYCAAD